METIGGFELHRSIGAGRVTDVYLARDVRPDKGGQIVAVKRPGQRPTASPDAIDRALAAARSSLAIDHASFVHVLAVSDEPPHFIAVEHVQGQTWRAIFEAQKASPLGMDLAVSIAIAAADGLSHAHDLHDDKGRPLGLVHGALSPENLFVTYDGQVKIADLGWTGRALDSRRAGGGSTVGRYMSPEQAIGARVDKRSDVFALGAILWELLTSRPLFEASTPTDLVTRITIDEIPSPRSRNPEVPERLASIVQQALTRSLVRRTFSLATLSRELTAYLRTSKAEVGPLELAKYMRTTFAEQFKMFEQIIADLPPPRSAAPLPPTASGRVGGVNVRTQSSEPPAQTAASGMTGDIHSAVTQPNIVLPEEARPFPSFSEELHGATTQPLVKVEHAAEPLPSIVVDPAIYEAAPVAAPEAPKTGISAPVAAPEAPKPEISAPVAAPETPKSGISAPPSAAAPASARPLPPPLPVAPKVAALAPTLHPETGAASAQEVIAPEPPAEVQGSPTPAPPSNAPDISPDLRERRDLDLPESLPLSRWRSGWVLFALFLLATAAGVYSLLSGKTDPSAADAADTGAIFIRSDPEGANIEIDGRPTGKVTPTRIEALGLGAQHEVRLTLEGYLPWTATARALVEIRMLHAMLAPRTPPDSPRSQPDAAVPLHPAPTVPPPRGVSATAAAPTGPASAPVGEEAQAADANMGFLSVVTDLRAVVHIDGRSLGRAPLHRIRVPAGTHNVRVQFEGEGGVWRDARVDIRPGWEFTLRVTME